MNFRARIAKIEKHVAATADESRRGFDIQRMIATCMLDRQPDIRLIEEQDCEPELWLDVRSIIARADGDFDTWVALDDEDRRRQGLPPWTPNRAPKRWNFTRTEMTEQSRQEFQAMWKRMNEAVLVNRRQMERALERARARLGRVAVATPTS